MAEPAPKPPVPRKEPRKIEQLGRVRVDDYAWMKDDNWQAVLRDPSLHKAQIREHLVAENTPTPPPCSPTPPRCASACSRR